LHIPLGIYYIHYIVSNGLASGTVWIIAIIYTIAFAAIVVGALTYKVMPNKNTKYIFDKVEMERFHVGEKIENRIK
jgi:hypothetical protein